MFEDTKVGSDFLYIHDLVHVRAHTTTIWRNLENRHLRLGTNRIQIRRIERISAIHSKIISGDQREANNAFLRYGVQTDTHLLTARQKVAMAHLLLHVDVLQVVLHLQVSREV